MKQNYSKRENPPVFIHPDQTAFAFLTPVVALHLDPDRANREELAGPLVVGPVTENRSLKNDVIPRATTGPAIKRARKAMTGKQARGLANEKLVMARAVEAIAGITGVKTGQAKAIERSAGAQAAAKCRSRIKETHPHRAETYLDPKAWAKLRSFAVVRNITLRKALEGVVSEFLPWPVNDGDLEAAPDTPAPRCAVPTVVARGLLREGGPGEMSGRCFGGGAAKAIGREPISGVSAANPANGGKP